MREKRGGTRATLAACLYDLALLGGPEMLFIGPRRRKLIEPLRGLVLEIGAGTGLSLRYYSPGARVVATEPDAASLERLAQKARSGKVWATAVGADAMRLPFGDAVFDGLVCNLALCTIPDPAQALREAQRVLKPGAPARFLEHVRSEGRIRGRAQDALAPLWARMADGCRLNQDTEAIIRRSGLKVERVEVEGGLVLPMKLIWTENDR